MSSSAATPSPAPPGLAETTLTGTSLYTPGARPLWWHLNPARMASTLWKHRELCRQFAARELAARYRGQTLGWLWAVMTPLLLLGVYTFVFAVVFKTRWTNDPNEPLGEYALAMFSGLLIFSLFREVVAKSPSGVVNNRAYVKKVVFPLEILAPSDLLVALANLGVGLGVWTIGWLAIMQRPPHVEALLLPVLLLPAVLLALGVSWFLSALGVFLRDIQNIVELGLTMLFFATPIFYSLQRVPEAWRPVLSANPLAIIIEDARRALMLGVAPRWEWYAIALGVSACVALAGYAFFAKSKRAFADVI